MPDPTFLVRRLSKNAGNPWVPYVGPKGGKGAQNLQTKEVVYGFRAQALLAGHTKDYYTAPKPTDGTSGIRELAEKMLAPYAGKPEPNSWFRDSPEGKLLTEALEGKHGPELMQEAEDLAAELYVQGKDLHEAYIQKGREDAAAQKRARQAAEREQAIIKARAEVPKRIAGVESYEKWLLPRLLERGGFNEMEDEAARAMKDEGIRSYVNMLKDAIDDLESNPDYWPTLEAMRGHKDSLWAKAVNWSQTAWSEADAIYIAESLRTVNTLKDALKEKRLNTPEGKKFGNTNLAYFLRTAHNQGVKHWSDEEKAHYERLKKRALDGDLATNKWARGDKRKLLGIIAETEHGQEIEALGSRVHITGFSADIQDPKTWMETVKFTTAAASKVLKHYKDLDLPVPPIMAFEALVDAAGQYGSNTLSMHLANRYFWEAQAKGDGTNTIEGVVAHEMGHFLHDNKDPQAYAAIERKYPYRGEGGDKDLKWQKELKADGRFIYYKHHVSTYATTHPYEFVAEIHGLAYMGRKFPPEIIEEYKRWGGRMSKTIEDSIDPKMPSFEDYKALAPQREAETLRRDVAELAMMAWCDEAAHVSRYAGQPFNPESSAALSKLQAVRKKYEDAFGIKLPDMVPPAETYANKVIGNKLLNYVYAAGQAAEARASLASKDPNRKDAEDLFRKDADDLERRTKAEYEWHLKKWAEAGYSESLHGILNDSPITLHLKTWEEELQGYRDSLKEAEENQKKAEREVEEMKARGEEVPDGWVNTFPVRHNRAAVAEFETKLRLMREALTPPKKSEAPAAKTPTKADKPVQNPEADTPRLTPALYAKITPDERRALVDYTHTDYRVINRLLDGHPMNEEVKEEAKARSRTEWSQRISTLDAAIEKAPRFSKPVRLWHRPTLAMDGQEAAPEMMATALAFYRKNVGKVIQRDAFTSTSANPNYVRTGGWVQDHKGKDVPGYVLEFITDKGLPLSKSPGERLTLHDHEEEVLLPRNTRWRVEEVVDNEPFDDWDDNEGKHKATLVRLRAVEGPTGNRVDEALYGEPPAEGEALTTFQGIPVIIERPRGTIRRGQDKNGRKWERRMVDHYGRIPFVPASDGEPIDVYVGPKTDSKGVAIIHQVRQDTGKLDEVKVMLGYASPEAAVQGYAAHYPDGWTVGPVAVLTLQDFKDWLINGDTKRAYPGITMNAWVPTREGAYNRFTGRVAKGIEANRILEQQQRLLAANQRRPRGLAATLARPMRR